MYAYVKSNISIFLISDLFVESVLLSLDWCEKIMTNGTAPDYLLANNFNIVLEDMVDDPIGDQNFTKRSGKNKKMVPDHIYKDFACLVNKQENAETYILILD